jgi:hypothetical protein
MARLMFALRVRAEPGVDAIRSLRAWLKRGLRDHGLRCLEIQQVNDKESDMAINLNDADDQNRSVMPPGAEWVRARIKRGNSGENGLLTLQKNQHGLMLVLELTVLDNDKWRGKKITDYIGCEIQQYDSNDDLSPSPPTVEQLEKVQTSVRMGRSRLKAMLNSAYGLMPNDDSDEARARRNPDSYQVFDGLCFMVQIEVQPAQGKYKESNKVDFIIEPDDPAYKKRESKTAVVTTSKPKPYANDLDDSIPFK